jgi:hypothetical protein
LQRFAFFTEYSRCDGRGPEPTESLLANLGDSPQEHEQDLLAYMSRSVCVAAPGAMAPDILNPSRCVTFYLMCDGFWLWRSCAEHFVRHYHYRVPREFLLHARRRGFVPPPEDEVCRLFDAWTAEAASRPRD